MHSVPLTPVDTMRIIAKKPFNFRYTVWKPSHFTTGLEQHSTKMSWRTFRVGGLLCGVVLQMEGDDTLRAEVYADGTWRRANRDRLEARLVHSYGLNESISDFIDQAERVPAMREPLAVLAGMRQSCPGGDHGRDDPPISCGSAQSGWMRVVVDTNVLVSGLLSPFGSPGVIVSLTAAGRLSLCSRARHGHLLHSECQQTKFL